MLEDRSSHLFSFCEAAYENNFFKYFTSSQVMTLIPHYSGAFLDMPIQCITSKVWSRMSLARGTSWAESPRLSVWCAYLVLHFSDLFVSCSCLFFLCFHRIISNLIMLLLVYFIPPYLHSPDCCSLIIPVLKEWVRMPSDFAELCSSLFPQPSGGGTIM